MLKQFGYYEMAPNTNGCKFTTVTHLDFKGSIPGFVKKWITKQGVKEGQHIYQSLIGAKK